MRCDWNTEDPMYIKYHDEEWGVPLYEDIQLFERISLEGAQAGLSWITILKKREEYRKVFDGFDPYMIRNYNEDKIESLMTNKGIVRNRRKIQSVISNAVAFIKVAEEFGTFSKFLWAYVDHTPIQNNHTSIDKVPAITELSITISGDLKRRGFKFVGPTIIYAMMQAIGMVNDHTTYCFRHNELKTRNDKKK